MSTHSTPSITGKGPQAQVFEVLSRSRARLERRAELGDALRLAQWHNQDDRPAYRQPGHHTLSVYLQGGQGTHLIDRPGETGAPGRYCVLPAEHESHWRVGGAQRFLHLYVSDQAWADRVVRLLDAEPRAMTLAPCIFGQDPTLAAWARQAVALDWNDTHQRLQAHLLSHAALDRLVLMAARPRARQAAERAGGGLAGTARRRVLEYIEQHLDGGQVLLGTLAALANLSEYHFARMFRVSMGCSVHAWITQRRLLRAQQALRARGGCTLAQVAEASGFGSASHLSQRFKQALGATPMQYRAALAGQITR